MDQKEVWPLFVSKLPISLRLNLIAFIVYVPLGIGLGVLTAVKRNSATDYIVGFFTMILSAIPSFIMIFALIYIFAYVFRWLPSVYPLGSDSVIRSLKGLIIPIFALSVGPVANLSRVMRGELTEALSAEYVLLAKVKGLTKKQTIFRHAF
ncbi:MAG: ABC transporter permease subunit, partial [Acholeplasmataceae bacterium]